MLHPRDRLLLDSYVQDIAAAYRYALEGATHVCLLDQPEHRNLGDTFIWAGQERILSTLGVKVVYRATINSIQWDILDRINPDIPILCHGGGNMGDLWPAHEAFRRNVALRYPKRRIVLLPQSIHFASERDTAASWAAYSQAERLTIMARTPESLRLAHKLFPDTQTIYCMDSALAMQLSKSDRRPQGGALILNRSDKESVDGPLDAHPGDAIQDWSDGGPGGRLTWRLAGPLHRLISSSALSDQSRIAASNAHSRALAATNMMAAHHTFMNAQAVATNRLHAHIYCCLAGIPHSVADNSYGKISAVFNAYTGAFRSSVWADNLSDAYSRARTLVSNRS